MKMCSPRKNLHKNSQIVIKGAAYAKKGSMKKVVKNFHYVFFAWAAPLFTVWLLLCKFLFLL